MESCRFVNKMNCDVLTENTTLTVFTLNCWGIPWLTKDYRGRMKAIGNMLGKLQYDVVCLQEVWSKSDFEYFQRSTKDSLKYSHYFYSGVMGSGICIFSKWPIVEALFHQWQVNGYMHKIFHGDWFGGKGVGLCRLDINGFQVNVFTAHLHAQYDCNSDEYLAHRVTQAFDTAQFIRFGSDGADLSVLAADLNTEPTQICYDVMLRCADLIDAYQKDGVDYEGTYNSPRNSYSDGKSEQGERIDHILYRAGHNIQVDCTYYGTPLEKRVPKERFSYSDHEAIAATFKISRFPVGITVVQNIDKKETAKTIDDARQKCEKALKDLKRDKVIYWMITIPLILILLLLPTFTDLPQNYSGLYTVFSFCATVVFVFSSLMATVWNRMEYHGILNAVHGMKFLTDFITKKRN